MLDLHATERHLSGAAATAHAGGAERVLYVWDDDYPWDVRTQKVCAALSDAGRDVHLLARNRGRRSLVERLPEGTVHRLPPWPVLGSRGDAALQFPAFFNPRWLRHLARTVRAVRPDVLLVRDLPLCPTALHVGRRYGIPVILDMAEDYAAMLRATRETGSHRPWDVLVRNPTAVEAVERWCLTRVDHVLVVIEESGARLVRDRGMDRARITIVSNTPPRARALAPRVETPGTDGRPLDVTYLGIFEVPRGIGELLEAVALLRDDPTAPPVRLTLIGDGRDAARFRAQAARLRLSEREVVFAGYLPNEEALRAVAAADIGVVPHHDVPHWRSTIPNKLFDYMAAGLAVVTSDVAPAARVVRDAGAGAVFRAGDAADLARAFLALRDPERRRSAGEAGRRAVLTRHHWECDAQRLVRAVDKVAARRIAPRAGLPT